MLGSAPVTKSFLQKLGAVTADNTRILGIYGMTEVGGIAFIEAKDKLKWDGQGDLVGEVLDTLKSISSLQIQGPKSVKSLYTARHYTGYFGHPPRDKDAGLSTGDLGQWVEFEGRRMLVLEGRIKDMIIEMDLIFIHKPMKPIDRTL